MPDGAARVNPRNRIARALAAIAGLELVAIEHGLGGIAPSLADRTWWLLLRKEVYEVEHARLVATAPDSDRRAYFVAAGADLGDRELRVTIFGHGEPRDVVIVRPRAPFVDWARALVEAKDPTSVFLFDEARDVAVLLLRRGGDLTARVARGARARLDAASAQERAASRARGAAEVARVRASLEPVVGVEIAPSPDDAPPFEMLVAGVPWFHARSARRLHTNGDAGLGPWLDERLATLDPGGSYTLWTRDMTDGALSLRAPPTGWLAEVYPRAPIVLVCSADRTRTLALRRDEYEDRACIVPVSTLRDRVESRAALVARLADHAGVVGGADGGSSDVDLPQLFAPSCRRARGVAVDPAEATAYLAALLGDFDMPSYIPDVMKHDGAIGCYLLSIGREPPLGLVVVFAFDDGRWLADLWRTGLDHLVVLRPDQHAALAIRREADGADVFLDRDFS
jgi:hypothetical protein